MNGKLFLVLILSVIFGATKQLHGLVQIDVTGNWQETIDSSDLIYGPEIILPSVYTSPRDAADVDITADINEKWIVSVSRNDSYWDPRMHLFVRRTSNGIGRGKISGGLTYQEITSMNNNFFSGTRDLRNIFLQFQLRGVSLEIPPASYNTTIIYTITSY